MERHSYDFVIVGGGTAGCVVAARLSENPKFRVALIEAGPDLVPGKEPAHIRDLFPVAYGDPANTWSNLVAEVGCDPGDSEPVYSRQFNQGRVLGGCSSINGMLAQRGLASDYDEWEALGATGWSWKGVLPFFNKLERDWDCDGPLHGKAGPIDIRRARRQDAPPFSAAMLDAMQDAGYSFHCDMNGYFGDCITTVPLNNTPNGRVSAATAYLTKEVRQRSNLTVLTDTNVSRLLISNGRVTGVEYEQGAGALVLDAQEVIVSGGAIQTPLLLMRSGIGPKEQLERAGISVLVDRQGVGQSLFNHAATYLAVHMPRGAQQSKTQNTWASTLLRYSSKHPGSPPGDMQIFPSNRSAWHPLGWRVGVVGMFLYKPFSKGYVALNAKDPAGPPIVKFRLLSDPRDFDRMVDCVAKTAYLLASPKLNHVINDAFVPPGGQANSLNKPGLLNLAKSYFINWIFDFPFGVRRYLLRKHIVDLNLLAVDRSACAKIVRKTAAGVHHVSGTCRMGRPEDDRAVVDPRGRVYGVQGLRIADASVMPSIVSANIHIPVLMIGEKIAEMIAADYALATAEPVSNTRIAGTY